MPKPAFYRHARALVNRPSAECRGDLFVAAGSGAWDQARYWRAGEGNKATVMLPPGEDPERIDWSIARDAGVFLVLKGDYPHDLPDRLVVALIRAGATVVHRDTGGNDGYTMIRPLTTGAAA